jgi:hypothetical protein
LQRLAVKSQKVAVGYEGTRLMSKNSPDDRGIRLRLPVQTPEYREAIATKKTGASLIAVNR